MTVIFRARAHIRRDLVLQLQSNIPITNTATIEPEPLALQLSAPIAFDGTCFLEGETQELHLDAPVPITNTAQIVPSATLQLSSLIPFDATAELVYPPPQLQLRTTVAQVNTAQLKAALKLQSTVSQTNRATLRANLALRAPISQTNTCVLSGGSPGVVVPDTPQYDKTGVADISVALENFINAQPSGTTILFQPNAVYRCEQPIEITDKIGYHINGRGATLKSTIASPTAFTFVADIDAAESDSFHTGVNRFHMTPTTAPFGPLENTIYAWYVKGPGIFGLARAGQAQYESNSRIWLTGLVQNPILVNGATFTITSPADRTRANIRFTRGRDHVVENLTIAGCHPTGSAFNVILEAQHCIDIVGTKNIEVKNCTLRNAHGDSCTLANAGSTLCSANIHDNVMYGNGRHGMAIMGCEDTIITGNTIRDVERHLFDVEPNSPQSDVLGLQISDNDCLRGGLGFLAISAYAGAKVDVKDVVVDGNRITDTLNIPVGTNHSGSPRWGPFTFTNNIATVTFGTGASLTITTVAAGSNGDNIATPSSWTPAGVLNVASTGGFSDSGQIRVFINGVQKWIKYTGRTATTFTGCTLGQPVTGTLATGQSVEELIGWETIPAVIKFQFCDGITVTGNTLLPQGNRGMWGVWDQFCTGVTASNDMTTENGGSTAGQVHSI